MTVRTVVQLVDDLDESIIENGDGQTIRFGIDGQLYTIDLTNEHADELREALGRYVDAARKTGSDRAARARPKATRGKTEVSPQAVREWARANKIGLSARGRLPLSVVDQFRAAGN